LRLPKHIARREERERGNVAEIATVSNNRVLAELELPVGIDQN
jgi:hypothetical protein